jgi:hypothetical protein
MAFFICEAVPNPNGLLPYKVVFKRLGSRCWVNGQSLPSPKERRRSPRRFARSIPQSVASRRPLAEIDGQSLPVWV